ncbi:hypothetical protein FRX31_025441 [Thalictrum thalictroides]|uniref:DDE Tnp4 domain-containing protein n=1 Tax=Thalictrum thalictroides TaxID=46969 RepID=A0A7J6VJ91_THATH|nr:hypothetical protein FRX31_025441 [Thalictrum thalictroides]
MPPKGKYYVVDSGYANRVGFLTPYKGERRHTLEDDIFKNYEKEDMIVKSEQASTSAPSENGNGRGMDNVRDAICMSMGTYYKLQV